MSDERELTAYDGKRDHELGRPRRFGAGTSYQIGYNEAKREAESVRRAKLTPQQRAAEDANSAREATILMALGAIIAGLYLATTWIERIARSQSWFALYYRTIYEAPPRFALWIIEYFKQAFPDSRLGSFRVADVLTVAVIGFSVALLLWLFYIVFWRFRVLRWLATIALFGPFAVAVVLHHFG